MAKKEFTYGTDYKFTPEELTYNGVPGAVWIQRRLSPTGWMHMGKQFVRSSATRADVIYAFGLIVRPERINSKNPAKPLDIYELEAKAAAIQMRRDEDYDNAQRAAGNPHHD
jgi:hypothetical protein